MVLFRVGQCGQDKGLDFKAARIAPLAQGPAGVGGAQTKLADLVIVDGPLDTPGLHQSTQDP